MHKFILYQSSPCEGQAGWKQPFEIWKALYHAIKWCDAELSDVEEKAMRKQGMDISKHFKAEILGQVVSLYVLNLWYHKIGRQKKTSSWDVHWRSAINRSTMHWYNRITYLIIVIFLHSHTLRPENFTLKSA